MVSFYIPGLCADTARSSGRADVDMQCLELFLDMLPGDLLQSVLARLPVEALCALSATAKEVRAAASAPALWWPHLFGFFDGEPPEEEVAAFDPRASLMGAMRTALALRRFEVRLRQLHFPLESCDSAPCRYRVYGSWSKRVVSPRSSDEPVDGGGFVTWTRLPLPPAAASRELSRAMGSAHPACARQRGTPCFGAVCEWKDAKLVEMARGFPELELRLAAQLRAARCDTTPAGLYYSSYRRDTSLREAQRAPPELPLTKVVAGAYGGLFELGRNGCEHGSWDMLTCVADGSSITDFSGL